MGDKEERGLQPPTSNFQLPSSILQSPFSILAGIVGLAIFFRFYRLGEIPPGLHHDEAFECLKALGLLAGEEHPVFFEGNFGVLPFFIYLIALGFRLGGVSLLAGRYLAATIGVATIPLTYFFTRELLAQVRRTSHLNATPFLAALVMAFLPWHVLFSREGIEPILLPFFSLASFWLLWRAIRWRTESGEWGMGVRDFALAGLFLGLSLYTYQVAWLLPIFLLFFLAGLALLEKGFLRRHGWGLAVFFGVAGVIFAPLGHYFLTHPASFALRPTQVAVLAEGQGDVASNALKVLAMFGWRGDLDPRNNLPGRPVLDSFLFIAFLVGLAFSLVGLARDRAWRARYAFLLLCLVFMLLPTALSEYAPHFRRSLGAAPAVAVLAGLGLAVLLSALVRAGRFLAACFGEKLALLALGGGVAFSAVSAYHDYFYRWGESPDLYYAFDESLVEIAHYAISRPESERIYLSPVRSDHPTIAFTLEMAGERPVRSFDGRRCLVFNPGSEGNTTYLILADEDARSPKLLPFYAPGGEFLREFRDRQGKLRAVAFHVPAGENLKIRPQHPLSFNLGSQARFLGYDLKEGPFRPGEILCLTLYWQAENEMEINYTVFVHLLDETGFLRSQHDKQPGDGSYPTTAWLPGEIVLDEYCLPLPPDLSPGEYKLLAGMYDLRTMQRLPVLDIGSWRLEGGDSFLLGIVEIQ